MFHAPLLSVFAVAERLNRPFTVCRAATVAFCRALPSLSSTLPVSLTAGIFARSTLYTAVSAVTENRVSSGWRYSEPTLSGSVTRRISSCPSGTSPSSAVLRRYTAVPSSMGLSHSTVASRVTSLPSAVILAETL